MAFQFFTLSVPLPFSLTRFFAPVACTLTLSFSLPSSTQATAPPALETPSRIRVRPVAPNVFVHTSYGRYPGKAGLTASNGLVVRTAQGVVLIDTAWDPEQTEQLLRWVTDSLHERVRLAVITHAHDDRTGGLAVLQAHRIKVYSTPLTAQRYLAKHPQQAAPTPALKRYTLIRAGRTRVELFFPGAGHSADNMVAWLPKQKLLFGGELVREQAATNLGPLEDANLKQWPLALRTLATRYPKARIVIPGHGQWGNPELLVHTHTLLRQESRRQPQTALNE
ncbi:BcII family subclass B1 metallo-beta-lactamase [Hymenobacter seoulensis]